MHQILQIAWDSVKPQLLSSNSLFLQWMLPNFPVNCRAGLKHSVTHCPAPGTLDDASFSKNYPSWRGITHFYWLVGSGCANHNYFSSMLSNFGAPSLLQKPQSVSSVFYMHHSSTSLFGWSYCPHCSYVFPNKYSHMCLLNSDLPFHEDPFSEKFVLWQSLERERRKPQCRMRAI